MPGVLVDLEPFFCQLFLVFATSCGRDMPVKSCFSESLRLAVVTHLQTHSSVGTAPSTFHSPRDCWSLSLMPGMRLETGVSFALVVRLRLGYSQPLDLGRAGSSDKPVACTWLLIGLSSGRASRKFGLP